MGFCMRGIHQPPATCAAARKHQHARTAGRHSTLADVADCSFAAHSPLTRRSRSHCVQVNEQLWEAWLPPVKRDLSLCTCVVLCLMVLLLIGNGDASV